MVDRATGPTTIRPTMTIKTVPKTQLNNAPFEAWNRAKSGDRDGQANGYITRAELENASPNKKVVAQLLKLHDACLKKMGRTTAVKTGDFYAFAKSLLPEIRDVADHRGNADGKISNADLKHLSAAARALVRFHDEFTR